MKSNHSCDKLNQIQLFRKKRDLVIDSQKNLDGKILVESSADACGLLELALMLVYQDWRRHHDIACVVHGFRFAMINSAAPCTTVRLHFILLLLGGAW